jgi:hypothetical protein
MLQLFENGFPNFDINHGALDFALRQGASTQNLFYCAIEAILSENLQT